VVDGHIGNPVHLATGPGDGELFNALACAQPEVDARIGSGHVAHSTLGLLDLPEPFCNQCQRGSDTVAVGARPHQFHFQPIIAVPSVVAQELRIISAVISHDVEVAVIVVIGYRQAVVLADFNNDGWTDIAGQVVVAVPPSPSQAGWPDDDNRNAITD
jgi:hypothetical protein